MQSEREGPGPPTTGDDDAVFGVVGCGTMGSGIAAAGARAGYRVIVKVLDDRHAEQGSGRVRHILTRDEETARALDRVTVTTDYDDLRDVPLVIEAVPERLEDKRAVFADLAGCCGPQAILASNTSSLPVIELAVATGGPQRVVGLHFFNPAPVMPLVELARTVATTQDVVDRARTFAESLGKTVVVCRDRAGFIANLLLFPYLNEAVKLLDSGYASREDIDTAMRLGAGHPMGPLELIDLIGLDACMQILESLHRQFADVRFAPAPPFRQLVTAGFTGRKSGRGFYAHDRADPPGAVDGPGVVDDGGATHGRVTSIGVVGTGTVATGVAEVAARSGFDVTGWGRTEDSCSRGRAAVERSTGRAVDRGKLPAQDREGLLGAIRWTTDLDEVAAADLVVEAVAEVLEVKTALFAALGRAAADATILSTATSSLPVIDLAAASDRADRVLGLHFFNPVPAMKLVEVVATVATAPDTLATGVAVVRRLGKVPVQCRDRAGFIVNRLLFPYLNDAARMVEEGYATAAEIDQVMTLGCNHPVGPLALVDLVGLDVSLQILRSLHSELREPGFAPVPLLEHMVRAGFLGRKSGRGFRAGGDVSP